MQKQTIGNIITGLGISAAIAAITLLSPLPRVTISVNNTIKDCAGQTIGGVTINASNVTLRNCTIDRWEGTGLTVNGSNNTIENIVINDGALANGDKDGIRFFGSGHNFKNVTVSIFSCADPAHCDGVQTYGSNSGKNTIFDGMRITNFTIYQTGSSYLKGQCFQMEYGASNITITNSILNCYRGINLGDSRYPATDTVIITNNTFIGLIPPPVSSVLEWGVFISKGSNTLVRDNIFYNIVGEHLLGSMSASHNLVFRDDNGRLYDPHNSGDLWNVNPFLDDNYCPTARTPAGVGAECATSVPPTPTMQVPTLTKSPTPQLAPTGQVSPTVTIQLGTPTIQPITPIIIGGTPFLCSKPCTITIP